MRCGSVALPGSCFGMDTTYAGGCLLLYTLVGIARRRRYLAASVSIYYSLGQNLELGLVLGLGLVSGLGLELVLSLGLGLAIELGIGLGIWTGFLAPDPVLALALPWLGTPAHCHRIPGP